MNETATIASIRNLYSRVNSVALSRARTLVPIADNSTAAARQTGSGRSRGRSRSRAGSAIYASSRGRSSTSTSRSSSIATTLAANNEQSDDDADVERIRETIGIKTSTTLRKHNERPNLYTT